MEAFGRSRSRRIEQVYRSDACRYGCGRTGRHPTHAGTDVGISAAGRGAVPVSPVPNYGRVSQGKYSAASRGRKKSAPCDTYADSTHSPERAGGPSIGLTSSSARRHDPPAPQSAPRAGNSSCASFQPDSKPGIFCMRRELTTVPSAHRRRVRGVARPKINRH
jgi:hypothetical protein